MIFPLENPPPISTAKKNRISMTIFVDTKKKRPYSSPVSTNQPTPKKMKYAIINTMDRYDTIVGSVLSTHRTLEAAEREDADIQRRVKRANGQNSYLPTIIAEVDPKAKKGMRIHESLLIEA